MLAVAAGTGKAARSSVRDLRHAAVRFVVNPKHTPDSFVSETVDHSRRARSEHLESNVLRSQPTAAIDVAATMPAWFGARYRVEERLGKGGMAEVFRVHDASTG
jgi:hypothetical protein